MTNKKKTVTNTITDSITLFMSLLQILEYEIPVSIYKSKINISLNTIHSFHTFKLVILKSILHKTPTQ